MDLENLAGGGERYNVKISQNFEFPGRLAVWRWFGLAFGLWFVLARRRPRLARLRPNLAHFGLGLARASQGKILNQNPDFIYENVDVLHLVTCLWAPLYKPSRIIMKSFHKGYFWI